MRKTLLLAAALVLAAIGPASGVAANAAAGPCGTTSTAPTYQHVIWIWMENHSLSDIIGNTSQAPYLNSLATECGLATNYHNISHPSLPNYLAATSGLSMSQLPVLSYTDCSVSSVCDTSAPSIFGQGETWKAYHPGRRHVGHPVQPLLAAGHRRAAARPGRTGPGRVVPHAGLRVQPVTG